MIPRNASHPSNPPTASHSTTRSFARRSLMDRGRTICESCGAEVSRTDAYELWRGNRLFWVWCFGCLRSPATLQELPDGLHIEAADAPATIMSASRAMAGVAPFLSSTEPPKGAQR